MVARKRHTDMTANTLAAKLSAGELIVLDGAIGTELERLGAPMHNEIWCGNALETHPELVREVHRSYIAAGADVITANSYSTARHALNLAGLGDKTFDWNQRAMKFATEARDSHAGDRPVWIAGSVSPFGSWQRMSADELRPSFAEQARILVDNGADLLILETLASPPDVVFAAVEETAGLGVPVWVGISCLEDRQSGAIMHGVEESQEHGDTARPYEPFGQVVEQAMSRGGSAALMMHSDLNVTRGAVEILRKHYDGAIGAYPNAGYWERPTWAFVDQIEPDVFAANASEWVDLGASIVGGCCGIGPAHIEAFTDRMGRRRN